MAKVRGSGWRRTTGRTLFCEIPKKVLATLGADVLSYGHSFHGGIAQLVERLNGIQKVRSSTLLTSTIKKETRKETRAAAPVFFVVCVAPLSNPAPLSPLIREPCKPLSETL